MKEISEPNKWLYVLIQKKDGEESLAGYTDGETRISFIPAFCTRKMAEVYVEWSHSVSTGEHEIQAIIFDDLKDYCVREDFSIFMIDDSGCCVEKIHPAAG